MSSILTGFELSAQQKRLWALREQVSGSCVQCALRIEGRLEETILEKAIRGVVERHEILRTTFHRRPGERFPLQVIDSGFSQSEDSAVTVHSASEDTDLDSLLVRYRAEPSDLTRGPLLRVALLRKPQNESVAIFTLPSLCGDGATLLLLAQEVLAGCGAVAEGDTAMTGEPLQYLEYAAWQQELAQSGDPEIREGMEYWKRFERVVHEPVVFPWEKVGESRGFRFGTCDVSIDREVSGRVDAEAQRYGASMADFLLAAWQVLVWRSTGTESFVIGRLNDGRKLEGLQEGLGPYAAYLPVRSSLRDKPRFCDVLEQVHDTDRRTREWEELGPAFMAHLDDPLQVDVGFECLTWPKPWKSEGLRFSLVRRFTCGEGFKIHLAGRFDGGDLTIELLYDLDLFSELDVRRLAECFSAILRSAASNPLSLVGDLEILPDEEKHRILVELNDSGASSGGEIAMIHRLFEEKAASLGNEDAVVFEDKRLTYAELNARANQLAGYLRARGVGAETIVALLLDRSLDLVVCLLGVLKAGGAYVPLDPQSPPQRLGLMIDEVKPRVILTQEKLTGRLPAEAWDIVVRIDEDWHAIEAHSRSNLSEPAAVSNLLYVLFTSGSTGRPKGVGVEHRQMLNYVRAIQERLDISSRLSFAMVSTFSADLGNTAIFPSLCLGGCLHLLSEERALDPEAFAEYMRRSSIDVLKIVPSHLASLLSTADAEGAVPLKHLILGGESPSMDLIRKIEIFQHPPAISNHYGPTETTVGICTHRWQGEHEGDRTNPLLGRPLSNCRIYLLDGNMQPVPAGVPGELYIGGAGLSRGYLGQPALTAERFVPDPLAGEAGGRLYRTGDLARLFSDGSLVFLGRIDHQHKIRGFRVETGEIESVLRQHAGVRDAVVVVREDSSGGKRLVAYAVPRRGLKPASEDLRAFLRQALPDYMVPSSVVLIDAIPLNANGKIDRSALPVPEEAGKAMGLPVPPRTPVEEALIQIWSEILGIKGIGVHHNFFELGGDSILAIQIISKAHQAGIHLSPKQLFQHQTVAELAAAALTVDRVGSEQGVVNGPAPLTPIQHWFFERITMNLHHWNQALAFEVTQPLDPGKLQTVIYRLFEHHDALRMRFEWTGSRWSQRVDAPSPTDADVFSLIDLSALDVELCGLSFTAVAAQIQTSLDLLQGPIARMVLFVGPQNWQRLFLVAHHLVVDGVSWRILLTDLVTAYQQLEREEAIELPHKTTSFKRWAEVLTEQVLAGAFDGELADRQGSIEIPPLPIDHRTGENTVESARGLTVALDPEWTRALLQEVPSVYNTQINDVLLTALTAALRSWTGSTDSYIDLEGHGREELLEEIDLSRTVGWFTSRFPVRLTIESAWDVGSALKNIKEQMRQIPSQGIGYGLLHYIGFQAEQRNGSIASNPRISFNYLGQMDQVLTESSPLRPAREPTGPSRSPAGPRTHELEINARILGGRLEVRWTYSEALHHHESIARLASDFISELEAIVEHCQSPGAGGYTMSDFPLAKLDEAKLRQISAALRQVDSLELVGSEQ